MKSLMRAMVFSAGEPRAADIAVGNSLETIFSGGFDDREIL